MKSPLLLDPNIMGGRRCKRWYIRNNFSINSHLIKWNTAHRNTTRNSFTYANILILMFARTCSFESTIQIHTLRNMRRYVLNLKGYQMAKKYICLQPSLVVWFLWYRFHSTRYTAQPESESVENIKFGTGKGIVSGGQKARGGHANSIFEPRWIKKNYLFPILESVADPRRWEPWLKAASALLGGNVRELSNNVL